MAVAADIIRFDAEGSFALTKNARAKDYRS